MLIKFTIALAVLFYVSAWFQFLMYDQAVIALTDGVIGFVLLIGASHLDTAD